MSSLDKLGDREQFYVGEIKRLEEEIAAIQAGTSELTKGIDATIAGLKTKRDEARNALLDAPDEESKSKSEAKLRFITEDLKENEAERDKMIASRVSSLEKQIHEYSETVRQLGTQAARVPQRVKTEAAQKRKKQAQTPRGQISEAVHITPLSSKTHKKRRAKSRNASKQDVQRLNERVGTLKEEVERMPQRLASVFVAKQPNSSPSIMTRSEHITKLRQEGQWTETNEVEFWYQEEDKKKEQEELKVWTAIMNSKTHTEAVYQEVWNKSLETISKTSKDCKLCDTHDTGKKGHPRPDLTIVKKNVVTPSSLNAVAYIELKGKDTAINQGEQLGQAAHYLERLMAAQPARITAYCILTNGKLETLVVKCVRTPGGLNFIQQEVAVEEPWRCFVAFVKATAAELGYPHVYTVGENKFVPGRHLGSGRSGNVYEVRAEEGEWATKGKDQQLVLKIFTHAYELEKEVETLQTLAKVQGVTSIVAHDAKSSFIVLQPRGRLFSSTKGERFKLGHARQLFNILLAVHDAGYVHRDVRPTNFYLLDDGKVVLGDWVDAVSPGVRVEHAGVRRAYLPPELREAGSYIATPKQDFYSFVLSCWELTTLMEVTDDLVSTSTGKYWNNVLTSVLGETEEDKGAFWELLSPLLVPN